MQNKKRRKRNRRIERGTEGVLGIVFVISLVLFLALNILFPSDTVYESENRQPVTKMRLTWQNISSGDYMETYEAYLKDHFAGREMLRSLRLTLSRIGGSREENNVIIGKGGQLLETIKTPDQDVLGENLDAISDFSDSYGDISVYMMLVPDAASVLSEKLPSLMNVADQKGMISRVKRELGDKVEWIDAENVLNSHADEKIYYETDRYWTSLGAYYVFENAAETMNIAKEYVGALASYPVSTTFNGALAAESGYEKGTDEVIDIYVPQEGDQDLVVSYVDEQRKTTSLYDSSKLQTSNQYEVFLGGDTSVIDIKTVSKSQRRLLVIKDSFANSFIPFLAPCFREIVVVDPRYYSGTIDEIMDTYRITDTLFLYSGNTFFQDNHISGVLSSEQQD